jgi:hypothetical protein
VALTLTAAGVDSLEVLATLLFVVVFSVALLGGRPAGFVAAGACTLLYLVLRSRDLDEVGPAAVGLLVLTRGGCYVAVAQVTQLVRTRLPALDLPVNLPTNWSTDDAPEPTSLYAGPVGDLGAQRAARARDPWNDPDATMASAGWTDDQRDGRGWADDEDVHADAGGWDDDEAAGYHDDVHADAGWPAEADPHADPHDDAWGPPPTEPLLLPQSPPLSTPAPVGWDQPPETVDAPWPGPAAEDDYDDWAPSPAEPPLAPTNGGGWDQPTGVMPQVPEAPAAPEPAPWEVDMDAPPAAGWRPGVYDRPPAPTMPTGWIDDATSPLGDETIPVGYTGELFIAKEMSRLSPEDRPVPRPGPVPGPGPAPANGAPSRVNGDPDHHHIETRPSNGRSHAGAPTAPAPTAPAAPVAAGPGHGYGAPVPPPAAPRRPAPGPGPAGPAGPGDAGGGAGYVPMSDPSEGIDPETRLWNARFFRERLATARNTAVRTGSGFSVVMIQVPDQPFQPLPYRRQVALLRELGHQFVQARVVDHLVHLPDVNQHWFAVVLTDSDRAEATAFERRLRSAIGGYLRNRGLHITEIQSLSLTSPDDDEAMAMVWSSLLGSSGGPAMAYDGQA